MDATASKKNRLANQLIADCKKMLGEGFSQDKLKETFVIIEQARSRGFLGAHKVRSCCFVESVNIANDILRICQFESEVTAKVKNPESLYVYISR